MIVGHAYIVPHGVFVSRHAVVLIDKVNPSMAEGRFLTARGEWGDPRRFKHNNIRSYDLGELSPRVKLDLLHKAIAKIDEDHGEAVRRADNARQADFGHLAKGFSK